MKSPFGAALLAAACTFSAPALAGVVSSPADGHASNPTWSPDGQHLSFELNKNTNTIGLYLMDVSPSLTGEPAAVKLPGNCSFGSCDQVLTNPSWHPNSQMAVFEGSNAGGMFRIYMTTPNNPGLTNEMIDMKTAPGHLTFPDVSPDGRGLLFVSGATGHGDVLTWDSGSKATVAQTSTDAPESFPLYAVDGQSVAFNRRDGDSTSVFVKQIGNGEQALVSGAGDHTRPVHAADGRIVYFDKSVNAAEWELRSAVGDKMAVLGQNIRLPDRARPALSPDGEWVAMGWGDPTKNHRITIAKIDGSKVVEVNTPYTAAGEPALTERDGRILLAFTALPASDAAWRFVVVEDVTEQLK